MAGQKLIVTVVGDTKQLTKSLNSAQQQINRFAGKSKISSTGADALLANVRGLKTEAGELATREAEVSRQSDLMNTRLGSTALKAGIAGFAMNALGRNLSELGGGAGRAGDALSALSTGDLVGFVKAARSARFETESITKGLTQQGDAAKANQIANAFAAQGFNQIAKAARGAADAIQAANNAFVDNTKIRDSTSPGSIAAEVSKVATPKPPKGKGGGTGVTQSQRNNWFDSAITRQLDRVQDVKTLQGQVSALKAIAAEIQQRIAVTKDITRKLTLEDEFAGVNRQRRGVETQIVAAGAARAKAIKDAADARVKAINDGTKSQVKAWRAQGDAAAAALNASIETVSNAGRNSRGGPLTATTGLNTGKLLSGLGLSRDEERTLRGRLSGFNSDGRALAGSPGLNLKISIDGRQVEHSVTKNQQKRARANPPRRRGGI